MTPLLRAAEVRNRRCVLRKNERVAHTGRRGRRGTRFNTKNKVFYTVLKVFYPILGIRLIKIIQLIKFSGYSQTKSRFFNKNSMKKYFWWSLIFFQTPRQLTSRFQHFSGGGGVSGSTWSNRLIRGPTLVDF